MSNRFKLVVFDWDGTLMDSEARIVACLRGAIADVGLEPRPADQLRNVIGLGLREALTKLYPAIGERAVELLTQRYRHHFLTADKTPSDLFPGVEKMLHTLERQGTYLAVATGKGRVGLDRAIADTGLHGVFHVTRCADETASKPSPQMLLEIISILGTEPEETLMVGDTEYDMMMANNAGTPAVAVSYGVHARERLLQHHPLACLDDVATLSDWLLSEMLIGHAQQWA